MLFTNMKKNLTGKLGKRHQVRGNGQFQRPEENFRCCCSRSHLTYSSASIQLHAGVALLFVYPNNYMAASVVIV